MRKTKNKLPKKVFVALKKPQHDDEYLLADRTPEAVVGENAITDVGVYELTEVLRLSTLPRIVHL